MPQIEIGGAVLALPEGADDAAIQRAVDDFRKSPDFARTIDRTSGAPNRVRMAVGSSPLKDRLATLQRFYPDAVEHEGDNFLFSDPVSGRAVLYNPKGIDTGDAASIAREAAQAIGSGLGASFGAAGGFVAGAPSGPGAFVTGSAGAAYGAGLGAAAGGALFDAAMSMTGDRVDTRTLAERGVDTALDFVGGAVGQRAGELVGIGIKRAVGGGTDAARVLVERFRNLSITPPAGAVGGKAVGIVDRMLQSTPASAGVMEKAARETLEQTKAAADRVAQSFGQPLSAQGAGEVIRQAARRAAESFKFRQSEIYDAAYDLIGSETKVAVPNVAALKEAMEVELARAPLTLGPVLKGAIRKLTAIIDDADVGGGIAFGALREARTMIGRDVASPMLATSAGAKNEGLKRIYAALSLDLSDAAKAAGPEAAAKLATADRYTRLWLSTAGQSMQKLADLNADELAYRQVMSWSQAGGTHLARLRRNFDAESWDTIAGSVLGRLGRARAGAQDASGEVFSVSTFLTRWNELAPEAKQALFGGTRYEALRPSLDNLVEAVGSLKGLEKLTNSSNTSNNMIAHATLQTTAGALGYLAQGDMGGAMAGVVGAYVAPAVAAKLITSPSFVQWLSTPITSPNALSAHLGRLAAIAVAEPELREEIHQYATALRETPVPSKVAPAK